MEVSKKAFSEKQQRFDSSILLFLKICFLLLATISLFKIGYISKIRIIRLKEIKESYFHEKDKYRELTTRFDNLLSIDGQQRFMKDQDQMISRDRMRVIWR